MKDKAFDLISIELLDPLTNTKTYKLSFFLTTCKISSAGESVCTYMRPDCTTVELTLKTKIRSSELRKITETVLFPQGNFHNNTKPYRQFVQPKLMNS